MKKIFILLVLLAGLIHLQAGPVDTSTAYKIARNYMSSLIQDKSQTSIKLRLIGEKQKRQLPVYIFNLQGQKGFIIISSRDELVPILAYSTESNFSLDNLPPALQGWLDSAIKITTAARQGTIKQIPSTKVLWTKLLKKDINTPKAIIGPLLSTKWNQGKYYNTMCPADASGPDGHVWTGCVATAMAQVLKYWSYPDYGSGEHSYDHYVYGTQYANFASTHYKWDSMPNSLSDYNNQVAQLMYHCGVAVNMNYSTSGSGAYMSSACNALINYFDYSHKARLLYKGTQENWDSIITSQITQNRPVLYAGYGSSGHAFVVDGFNPTDSTYHINWGWGGSYNGWYRLDDLTPGSNNFNSGQQAIINLYPGYGDTSYTVENQATGTITDNGGYYNYENLSLNKWLIQSPFNSSIMLHFNSFLTVGGQDTLFIYDGADENAPLVAAFSGDTIPPDILSSGPAIFMKFVSDQWNTAPGFSIIYNCKPYDVGVISIIAPQGRAICGKNDSVKVLLQNFGYMPVTNIPVRVDFNTPSGNITLNALYTDTLAPQHNDSLFVGMINTQEPGQYTITAYTILSNDYDKENDTARSQYQTNFPGNLPMTENLNNLHYDEYGYMGQWYDTQYRTWLDYEVTNGDTNRFFANSLYNMAHPQLIYGRKLAGISEKTFLRFDLRIKNNFGSSDISENIDKTKIYIMLSGNCAQDFDTIAIIDTSNFTLDTIFKTFSMSLSDYDGEEIVFSLGASIDSGYITLNYDNFIVADSISNNKITGLQCTTDSLITLYCSTAQGGVPPLIALWQASTDGINWTTIDSTGNNPQWTYTRPTDTTYFRRIITDSLGMKDTSEAIVYTPGSCITADINIYPNPSQGHFTVEGLNKGTIEIISLSGQIIYSKKIRQQSAQIKINSLKPGIYIIRYRNKNQIFTKQLLIK